MADSSTEHTVITRICAKCKKILGYTEGYGVTGTSHGLCPKCRDETLVEAGLEPDDLEDHDRDCDCRACRTDRLQRAGDRRMEEARE